MAKNEIINREPMTYYDVEMSQPTFMALKDGAAILSAIISGDLSAVVGYALDAYRMRTGCEVPQKIEHNIRECARGLATWGWNRPYDEVTRTEDAKIFSDLARVLDLQNQVLNGGLKDMDLKECEIPRESGVPLPRVRSVYQSTQNRLKQLRVLTDKVVSKKPK